MNNYQNQRAKTQKLKKIEPNSIKIASNIMVQPILKTATNLISPVLNRGLKKLKHKAAYNTVNYLPKEISSAKKSKTYRITYIIYSVIMVLALIGVFGFISNLVNLIII